MLVRVNGCVEDLPPGVAADMIASGRAQRIHTGGVVAAPAVTYLVGEHACSLPVKLQEHATVPVQQTAVVPKNFEYRVPDVLSRSQKKRLAAQLKKAAGNGSPS